MNDLAIHATVALNRLANAIGGFLLAPLEELPDVASACAVAMATGIVMLLGFKYTSNQKAMKRIGDRRKAELLALSLFKDSIAVSLLCTSRVILTSLISILYTLVPIAVMIVPATLLLGQLSLWWQARPLAIGEQAVISIQLAGDPKSPMPDVSLEPTSAIETTTGPVRIRTQRTVCWDIEGKQDGYHVLKFHIGDQPIEKQLAIGTGTMRVSSKRPQWLWSDVVLYPAETPFDTKSPVKSIDIRYPERHSWVSGTHSWLIFWFLASTAVALCLRGVFDVNF